MASKKKTMKKTTKRVEKTENPPTTCRSVVRLGHLQILLLEHGPEGGRSLITQTSRIPAPGMPPQPSMVLSLEELSTLEVMIERVRNQALAFQSFIPQQPTPEEVESAQKEGKDKEEPSDESAKEEE
jgi:hypothetical protein